MKLRQLLCLILVTVAACVSDDFDKNSPKMAAIVSSKLCGKAASDMKWLEDLIQNSQTDGTLHGDVYAVKLDGRVIFIHQPMIMSCLACVLYDCEGNPIAMSTIDWEKLRDLMNSSSKIYTPAVR
jgi:hypothetical protein